VLAAKRTASWQVMQSSLAMCVARILRYYSSPPHP
jgi:hypothetical protein